MAAAVRVEGRAVGVVVRHADLAGRRAKRQSQAQAHIGRQAAASVLCTRSQRPCSVARGTLSVRLCMHGTCIEIRESTFGSAPQSPKPDCLKKAGRDREIQACQNVPTLDPHAKSGA